MASEWPEYASTLPSHPSSERLVLGAVMRWPEQWLQPVVTGLKPLDFYVPAHREIFHAILETLAADEPVESVPVFERLHASTGWQHTQVMSDVSVGIPRGTNVQWYIDKVRTAAARRRFYAEMDRLGKCALDDSFDPLDLANQASEAARGLTAGSVTEEGWLSMNELLSSALDGFEEIQKLKGGFAGIQTGFYDFDNMTSGLCGGDLMLLAARPSTGKTALALSMAVNMSRSAQVVLFSLEMPKKMLGMRLLTAEAGVDALAAKRGKLNPQEWNRLVNKFSDLQAISLTTCDKATIALPEILSRCQKLKATKGLKVVIVDHLHLMTSGGTHENRQHELSFITRNLKTMAIDLDVVVIALAQLSRAMEGRSGNKRPQLSDLRDSGALEQDADIVTFLYRPAVHGIGDDHSKTEFIVSKHRNGPTGSIELLFTPASARFNNKSLREEAK